MACSGSRSTDKGRTLIRLGPELTQSLTVLPATSRTLTYSLLYCTSPTGESAKMTAEVQKKNHHHHAHHHAHHHHSHPHKKMVSLRSIERITNLPVMESAHAYYEKIKVRTMHKVLTSQNKYIT